MSHLDGLVKSVVNDGSMELLVQWSMVGSVGGFPLGSLISRCHRILSPNSEDSVSAVQFWGSNLITGSSDGQACGLVWRW